MLSTGFKCVVRGGSGEFTYEPKEGDRVVFIAGGVGVTPLMSMLRTAARSKFDLRANMYLMCKEYEDIYFNAEL